MSRAVKLTASLFGKLRVYADFIEPTHRVRYGGELREWLTRGAEKGAAGLDAQEPSRLLWPDDRGRRAIAAVVWASADAIGRRFPFCLFSEVPLRKLAARSAADWPSLVAPVWDGLAALATCGGGRSWTAADRDGVAVEEVRDRVGRARILCPRDPPPSGPFSAISARREEGDAFLSRLLGAAHPVLFPRTVASLAGVARGLTGREPSPVAVCLRASEQVAPEDQAAFWLGSIEGMAGSRQERAPGLWLPPRARPDSGLWILYRPWLPLDAGVIFGADAPHSWLVDLRRPDVPVAFSASGAGGFGGLEGFEGFARGVQAGVSASRGVEELIDVAAGRARDLGL